MSFPVSTLDDAPTGSATPPPRGFIYFCEERRQYLRDGRAWIFWALYLTGAILLEPHVLSGGGVNLLSWLPLLGFLVLFPPVWRTLLRIFGFERRR